LARISALGLQLHFNSEERDDREPNLIDAPRAQLAQAAMKLADKARFPSPSSTKPVSRSGPPSSSGWPK
jgi:hypothetical protein